MLVLVEDLVEAVHGEEGDPGDVQLGDDLVGHGGLPAGRAAADADDERLDLLSLTVVPGRPTGRVNCPLGCPDDGLPLCTGERDLYTAAHHRALMAARDSRAEREQ